MNQCYTDRVIKIYESSIQLNSPTPSQTKIQKFTLEDGPVRILKCCSSSKSIASTSVKFGATWISDEEEQQRALP